jgi:integrase
MHVAKVRLTLQRIQEFSCPTERTQAFLWDADVPGLAVRATPNGAKSFVYQSRFNGGDLRLTIGDVATWPLSNRVGLGGQILQAGAREEARRLQSIIDSGRDPRQVKAETQAADAATRAAERSQNVTFGEAWDEYLADRKPHWGERHYLDHLNAVHPGGEPRKRSKDKTKPGPLAALLDEKLASLTPERFEAWAAKEARRRPGRSRLSLRLMKAFLQWCHEHKEYKHVVQARAASGKRVREKLGRSTLRQHVIQKEQLPAWFDAVRNLPNPVVSAYLQYLLLTGARPNEPLTLRWDDVNFRWNTIRIRDKVEGERIIGLTPYLHGLLGALPRRNQWVFSSSTSASGHLVDAKNAHDAACEAAGLPKITLQGLRRSFASLCEWIEVPGGVSAQIQGHAPQGVREQNYIRRSVDLLRHWHEKIEAWILEHAGIEVVPAPVQGLRRIK